MKEAEGEVRLEKGRWTEVEMRWREVEAGEVEGGVEGVGGLSPTPTTTALVSGFTRSRTG